MNDDKKRPYPGNSPEDNRFKNQDEFDNASPDERLIEQRPDEGVKTSTAEPDPDYRDVAEEDTKK